MAGNFDFLKDKFPELARDGEKAEKYLYSGDNEVCIFFISRIFDNAVKLICGFNDVKAGDNLAEPIRELMERKVIDCGIYLLLEMMRTFRNGNAHNKDYSLNDSIILLQESHILCEWLMETYGGTNYQRKGFSMPPRENNRSVTTSKPVITKAVKVLSDDEFIALCTNAAAKKIKAAISSGANPNAKDGRGRTALMFAVLKNSHPDAVDVLIDAGAKVNAKTNKGVKALTYSAHNKNLQGTETLKRLQKLTAS